MAKIELSDELLMALAMIVEPVEKYDGTALEAEEAACFVAIVRRLMADIAKSSPSSVHSAFNQLATLKRDLVDLMDDDGLSLDEAMTLAVNARKKQ